MRTSSLFLSMEEDVPALSANAEVVVISPEEEAILVGEIGDDTVVVNDMVEQSDRVVDTMVGLEDVLVIAEQGKVEPTDIVTASLVGAVGEMAVAGTPIDATNVITGVAMEDMAQLKNKVKEIWDAIWKHLKALWDHIYQIFAKVDTLIQKYDGELQALDKQLTGAKLATDIAISSFSTNGQKSITGAEAVHRWKDLEDASSNLLLNALKDNKVYLTAAKRYIDAVFAERSKDSVSGGLNYMNAAKELLDTVKRTPAAVKAVARSDKRITYTKILPDGYLAYSEPMKGNFDYIFDKSKDISDGMPNLGEINRLLQVGIHFESGNKEAVGIKVNVKDITAENLRAMIASARKAILNVNYYMETAQKQQQAQLNEIAKATDKLNNLPRGKWTTFATDAYTNMGSKLNTYATNHTVALQSKVIEYYARQISYLVQALKSVAPKGSQETKEEPAAA